jgi:TolA-binding protein
MPTLSEFKSSLSSNTPPNDLSVHGKALWHAGKGEWEKAHDLIQDGNDQASARIHAFLHRQEGDIANARYWYSKAATSMPDASLDKEWEDLVLQFL